MPITYDHNTGLPLAAGQAQSQYNAQTGQRIGYTPVQLNGPLAVPTTSTGTGTPTVISDSTIRDTVIPGISAKAQTMLPPSGVSIGANGAWIDSRTPTSQYGTPAKTDTQPGGANYNYGTDYNKMLADIDAAPPALSATEQQLYDLQSQQLDAESKATIARVQNKYSGLINTLQEKQGQSSEVLKNTLNIAGSGRYAPISSSNILDNKTTQDVHDLQELSDEENNLIAQAQSAKSQGDMQLLGLKLEALEKKKADKVALAGKIADQMNEQNKALRAEQAKEKEETEDAKSNLLLQATRNGAPKEVRDAIRAAGSYNDAIDAASQYMQSENDILDTQYKKAQIASIYNTINKSKQTGGGSGGTGGGSTAGSPYGEYGDQILAYASQYASTGKIPTGLPKGSFGLVSQVAKELPKQPGELVDVKTGIKPDANDTTTNAYASLYSAIELTKQLKELDKERWGGVTAGVAGKVFGSKDQQEYVDLRSQIIDLLARARSGAALTVSEERRYSDMLPGRFSEPFGLGANSDVRLNNFINTVSSDLNNKASSNGWAINGVSKVTIDGKSFTVGDIITNGTGQKGRINADGTITLVQ